MKHFVRFSTRFVVWLACLQTALAQCPAASSYTITSTPATCPSNGSITVSNSADQAVTGGQGVPGALYQLTSGPASGGYQTTAQSPNKFEGLPPGNYVVTITKDGCPNVTKPVTVANQYTQIAMTPVLSNVCPGNNTIGATITANSTGGTAPIRYAFVKSPNANIPDDQLTYGSSNTFQVTAATGGYGVYQVRAKDACGVFVTYSVDVAPTRPPARYAQGGLTKLSCSEYRLGGSLTTVGGTALTGNAVIGYRVELFDVTTVPNPCVIPLGATPLRDVVFTTTATSITVPLSARQFVVRTTSPCGEVQVSCMNLSSQSIFNLAADLYVSPSCQVVSNVRKMNVYARLPGSTTPIQVTIKTNTTPSVTIQTDTWSGSTSAKLYALDYVAEGYTFEFVDACGLTATRTITPPGEGATIGATVSTNLSCATVVGSRRVVVTLSGGAVGLQDAGTRVELTTGPSGTISPALVASTNLSVNQVYWNNLFPGTYTARIVPASSTYPACSPGEFAFTVAPFPSSPAGSTGLTFSLGGSVNALCGGTGTIAAALTYNGGQQVTYELKNASGTVLATNLTGTFTNVGSGTYTVRAYATPCTGTLVETTKSFTVPVADQPPLISKQLGVICESGNALLATGKAAFEFSGFGPFLIEVKPVGSEVWGTVATGVTGSSYVINSLTANETYDVRLTDNCGKSAVTTVSIKPFESQLTVLNTTQPCAGQNYTLEAPDYPATTYTWTKDGNVVSTDRTLRFTPYEAAYDGTYTAVVSVAGGCVLRTIIVTLNSAQCAGVLPVALKSFTARIQPNQTVLLEWATASEVNNNHFRLERSTDLQTFETLAQVPARDGGQRGASYRHVDAAPHAGTSYYRLHQIDRDGTDHTLRAVSVILREEAYGVYPNPVRGTEFTVRLNDPATVRLSLFNAAGRRLALPAPEPEADRVRLRLSTPLAPGLYLLLVEERGQTRTHRVMVR